MAEKYPERMIDAQAFKQLSALRDAYKVVGDTDQMNTHNQKLTRRLQATLYHYGYEVSEFYDLANFDDGERSNAHQGSFQLSWVEKVLKTAAKLSENPRRRTYASEWVSIQSEEAKKLINRTRKPLERLTELLHQSNEAGGHDDLISPGQKAQLIALLKSLLAELEGTHVDRGRVGLVAAWLGKIGLKVAEKAVGDALTSGFSSATEALGDLYGWLKRRPSSPMPEGDDGSVDV